MLLNLSNKFLTEIPIIPNNITELCLSHNNIKKIHGGCFHSGLRTIWLNNNEIEELDLNNLADNLA